MSLTEDNEGNKETVGAARTSDAKKPACKNCLNWQLQERESHGRGFCLVFDKKTESSHGDQCTAFDPWPF
jgi:hypothetical protein